MPQGGRYILCDRCKVSTFSLNLPWPEDGETMQAAREAGWRVIREEDVNYVEDVCPTCLAGEFAKTVLEEDAVIMEHLK